MSQLYTILYYAIAVDYSYSYTCIAIPLAAPKGMPGGYRSEAIGIENNQGKRR